MMQRARTIAEAFAAGSFAISTLLTALRTSATLPELHTEPSLLGPDPDPFDGFAGLPSTGPANLLSVVSQPTNPVLWALLGFVILAALAHLLTPAGRRPRVGSRLLPGGLLVAAVWPWVLNPRPALGLGLAALSCLLIAGGIVAQRGRPERDRDPLAPVLRGAPHALLPAFIAGWLVVAASSALGMYVHYHFGLGLERSVLMGLLLAALLGVWGQLRMERSVTFSLAIIWAMIGFSAAAAGASITIATACVLGIAALAVVMVRVTT